MRRRLLLSTALLAVLLAPSAGRAAGLLVPRGGGTPIEVRSHRVEAELFDGLARTTLRQTFVNPGSDAVEGIYVFPLPEGAALVSVAMETGGKRFEGLLVERKKARRIYDSIVHERRDPALVEEIGRNLFQLSVFPVLPKVTTTVELTWVTRVPLLDSAYRYVYTLSGSDGEARTEQDFTFRLKIRSSLPLGAVESSMKGLEILRPESGEVVATFEKMKARLDEDVVVTAKLAADPPGLTVSTYRGEDGDGWFLATITPPKPAEKAPLPRDMVVILDASGSMRGEKTRQARAAALQLLESLRPEDRINVVQCGSYAKPFAEEPLPATPETLGKLRKFVLNMEFRGGTALADAMGAVTKAPGLRDRNRVVVLITDGLPTAGETKAARLEALARSGARRDYRFFCLGLGYDANLTFLHALARAGRGRVETLREGEEVEGRLTAFLARMSSPAITDVKLRIFGLEVFDRQPSATPEPHFGEQVVLCGRYRGGGDRVATVTAKVGGVVISFAEQAHFREVAGGPGAIAWLFAREKLDHLEALLRLRSGLTDDAWFEVLSEGSYETRDEIVSEVLDVSRKYGVQASCTSFIVLLPEDRRRLDPRNLKDLSAALERARKARSSLAPKARAPGMSMSEIVDAGDSFPVFNTGAGGGDASHGKSPGTTSPGPATPEGAGGYHGGSAGCSAPPDPSRDWMRWWAANREEFLPPRVGLPSGALPAGKIEALVVPTLLRIIDDRSIHRRIRRAAVISLARCPEAGKILGRLARLLDPNVEKDSEVAGSAALALGLLPESEREPALLLIRNLISDGRFRTSVESGAALAAGLWGDRTRTTWKRLRFMVAERNYETSTSALFALGLIGDETPVPHLIEWLERDRSRSPRYPWFGRVLIIEALGRIGDPRALPTLLMSLREKSPAYRGAALSALGRLAPLTDERTRWSVARAIIQRLEREPHDRTRQVGLLALGRIAAASTGAPRIFTPVTSFLEDRFNKGNRAIDRPFAALALGIAGRGAPTERGAWRARIAKELRQELERRKGDKVVLGALAVALGILGNDTADTGRVLREILLDRRLPGPIRSGAAAGLGLIWSEEGMDALRAALTPNGERSVQTEVAHFLCYRCDVGGVAALRAKMLDRRIGVQERSQIMLVLGRYRDAEALDGLLRAVDREESAPIYTIQARAVAVAAIGHLVDDRKLGRIRPALLGRDDFSSPWALYTLLDLLAMDRIF